MVMKVAYNNFSTASSIRLIENIRIGLCKVILLLLNRKRESNLPNIHNLKVLSLKNKSACDSST